MSENEMMDKCLAALKKCQSEEEVKEALENDRLTTEELDRIWAGCGASGASIHIEGGAPGAPGSGISGGDGKDSIFIVAP